MFLRKKRNKPVNFGRIKPIVKFSIINLLNNERIEKTIYELPYRIGSALGNNFTIKEAGVDKFHISIILFKKNLYILNLSKNFPLYVENEKIEFAEPYLIEKSTSISVGNLKIFLMPELKRSVMRKNLKNFATICPVCAGKITIENKTCETCGFGSASTSRIKLSRFRNILELTNYRDAYYEYPTKIIENKTVEENDPSKNALLSIPPAKIRVLNSPLSGTDFEIVDEETSIGRSRYNSLSLAEAQDSTMSRFHCKIIKRIDGYYIKDNESLNGTFINGTSIKFEKLKDGDIIRLGKTEISFLYIKKGRKGTIWKKI